MKQSAVGNKLRYLSNANSKCRRVALSFATKIGCEKETDLSFEKNLRYT